MRSAALDPEVFIRSMGNRGRPGGLCPAVWDAVRVLEASGRDVVLIETAGTGQTEIDVVHYADTVILVVVPESGDEIQIQKAGVLEVADIVVLNKADRPGADRLGSELLELARADQDGDGWMRPVVRTVGTSGDGTRPLCEAIESHRQWLESSNRLERKRREQLGWELAARAKELMQGRLERIVESCEVEPLVERVCSGELGMREAVEAVTRAIAGG